MFWYPRAEDHQVVDERGQTLDQFLAGYNPHAYPATGMAVDNVILKTGGPTHSQVLLIRRRFHPYYNMYALPGGFVDVNETLRDAAARELFEETGLKDIKLAMVAVYDDPNRDPRLRLFSVSFAAYIHGYRVKAGDDAGEAKFFDIAYHPERDEETLILTNGETKLTSVVHREFDMVKCKLNRYVKSSDLAADHAIVIIDAIMDRIQIPLTRKDGKYED